MLYAVSDASGGHRCAIAPSPIMRRCRYRQFDSFVADKDAEAPADDGRSPKHTIPKTGIHKVPVSAPERIHPADELPHVLHIGTAEQLFIHTHRYAFARPNRAPMHRGLRKSIVTTPDWLGPQARQNGIHLRLPSWRIIVQRQTGDTSRACVRYDLVGGETSDGPVCVGAIRNPRDKDLALQILDKRRIRLLGIIHIDPGRRVPLDDGIDHQTVSQPPNQRPHICVGMRL